MSDRTVAQIVYNLVASTKKQMTQSDLIIGVLKEKGITVSSESIAKMQPNVSKALKSLTGQRHLYKTNNKTYVRYSDRYEGQHLKDDIINTVIFSKDKVYPLSKTVFLVGVDPLTAYQGTELFKAYLGTDQCFDVMYLNGYLVLLLNQDIDTEDLLQDIQSIMDEAIKVHETKTKQLIKLIKDTPENSNTENPNKDQAS